MITQITTSSNQNVNIWSTLTFREALKKTMFKELLGTGKSAIIMRLTELEKNAGDTIKYDLLMQMGNAGVTGDNRMRDNEEPLKYYQDSVKIDQLRNAHAFRRMSQQRTLHDLRMDAKTNLSDWFAERYDTYFFDYLCGNTARSFAGNTATAPDSDHYVVSGDVAKTGTIATDESSLGTNDQFTLADLDYCKESCITITPPIRPVMVQGGEYFVSILHPYSVVDMRLDVANSAYITWPDIQMYANKRGLDNPIFSGALGVYNGVIIKDSTRIYSPTTNVRRNLFLGAQAGVFAMGNAYSKLQQKKMGGDNLMSWFEDDSDYGNELGIAVGAIFGMKATLFNSKDFGKMVITSYAAKHSS